MLLDVALLWFDHAYLHATVARQLGYALVVCLLLLHSLQLVNSCTTLTAATPHLDHHGQLLHVHSGWSLTAAISRLP